MSSEQGAFEIYVRTFDGAGGPWRVSTAGGAHPTWSKNTQELMYVIDDQMMTVKYRLKGDTFEPERRARLGAGALRDCRPDAEVCAPSRRQARHRRHPRHHRGGQVRHGDVRLQFLRRAAAPAAGGTVGLYVAATIRLPRSFGALAAKMSLTL